MSEKLVRIDELDKLIEDKEEKLKKLTAQEDNLNGRIKAEELRFEATKKLSEVDFDKKKAMEAEKNLTMNAKLERRETSVKLLEGSIQKRVSDLEKREAQIVDLDKRYLKFREERQAFERLRNELRQKIDNMKIELAEMEGKKKFIQEVEADLSARLRAVVIKEKEIFDRIGEVEVKEKQVKTMTEHLESLKKEVSYAS